MVVVFNKQHKRGINCLYNVLVFPYKHFEEKKSP